MPAAARGPISAALGAHDHQYWAHTAPAGVVAINQGLKASFGRDGVSLSSGGSRLGIRLLGIGYGGSLAPVAASPPVARANRVSYAHGGVQEWYANGPAGLEQGFTIPRAPALRAAGPLTLSLELSGNLRPSLTAGTLMLERAGHALLSYGGLTASDGRGRPLRAWLVLREGRLLIRSEPLIRRIRVITMTLSPARNLPRAAVARALPLW